MDMKLSELKKQIKDNIYEILSEETVNEAGEKTAFVKGTAGSQAVEYNTESELQSLKDNPDVKGITTASGKKLKELDIASIQDIDKKIQNDPKFLEKIRAAMTKAEKGDNNDLATLMSGFKMFESDDEDKEPTKAELEKEKVKGAPDKFKISDEKFEDFKTKLKTVVEKIKGMKKGKERDAKMAALKQFIQNPELKKAFKERDVEIDTGELVG